ICSTSVPIGCSGITPTDSTRWSLIFSTPTDKLWPCCKIADLLREKTSMSDQIQQQQSPVENAIDPLILQAAQQRLKSEQNLVLAALAGGVSALLGACFWAAVTV